MAEQHPIPTNRRFHNLLNKRFGRLVVLEFSGFTPDRRALWLCQCDCGQKKIMVGSHLAGGTRSCGCISRERGREMLTTHSGSRTREYKIWRGILGRCENPEMPDYARYGGRGIRVCDRWHKFENFISDMGLSPPKHTIERQNVNGNYEPGNCRWATRKEQANNRRNSRMLTVGDITLTLAQWSDRTGLSWETLKHRMKIGWSPERIVLTPLLH